MNTTVDELKTLYVKMGGNPADVADLQTDAELIDKIEDIAVSVKKVMPQAECGSIKLFDTDVSDIQAGVNVTDNAIIGTLKYLSTGDIVDAWGAGNFVALKFIITDPDITHSNIQVGLNPSEGSGLVTLDEDLNGVFKVTDKDNQKFKVVVTKGESEYTTEYDLSRLNLKTE